MPYRWTARTSLMHRVRVQVAKREPTGTMIKEILADITKSGSWLASEARAAIDLTNDNQWKKLVADIHRLTKAV